MDDVLSRICDERGVFLRREALGLGYDDKSVARMVRLGAWHRVRHGAYVLSERWQQLDELERHRVTARAVLRVVRSPTILSHTSALLEHEAPIWDLPLDEVHTTRATGNAGRAQAGVRPHQGGLLPEDLVEVCGLPVTSPTRAALEVTTIADVQHSLVPVNHLLHTGATTLEDLVRRSKMMEFWTGTLSTRLILQLAEPRIESVGESRTSYHLWAQGLPRPEPQFEIFDARGRFLGRVDFAWPEYGVFLEFDGKVKYTKYLKEGESVLDAILREKKRERRICEQTGWTCIRVDWADLAHPRRLAQRVRAAMSNPPRDAA